jgi:hypothetical protein
MFGGATGSSRQQAQRVSTLYAIVFAHRPKGNYLDRRFPSGDRFPAEIIGRIREETHAQAIQ